MTHTTINVECMHIGVHSHEDFPEIPQPISRLLKTGSDTLQWLASKAQGLYNEIAGRDHSINRTGSLTPAVEERLYTERTRSSNEIPGRDNPINRTGSLTPVLEKRDYFSTKFSSSLTTTHERSPVLPFFVQESPNIPNTPESEIPETPQEETPSPHEGIDNKEAFVKELELEASNDKPATAEPATTKPDTNEYVTVKDFNRYSSQFKKMGLPPLDGDLDSRVKRQYLINYIRSNVHVVPALIAPDFVNEKEYFTRKELVDLVAKLFLYFDPFKDGNTAPPLEDYRSTERESNVSEGAKDSEGAKTKSRSGNKVIPNVSEGAKDSEGAKTKSLNGNKVIPNDSESSKDSEGTKTKSQSGNKMIPKQGSIIESQLSEVEFSKRKKEDRAWTRRAKKGMELFGSNSNYSIDIDPEILKKARIPLKGLDLPRAETYLLLDINQPLLPPGPGAGHGRSIAPRNVSYIDASTDSEGTKDYEGTKTKSKSVNEMIPKQGSIIESQLSEVEFSKIKKEDGARTLRVKKCMELCGSYYSIDSGTV